MKAFRTLTRRAINGFAVILLIFLFWSPSLQAATVRGFSPGLVTSGPGHPRLVALTFDDGPSVYTPRVLAVLHRFHVQATFFVVGSEVPFFGQFLREEVRDGNEIGNHTYSHPDLQNLSTPGVIAELARNQAVIRSRTGVTPGWFRPPYGDVDNRIIGIAASLGLRTVTWSVDPSDYTLPGVRQIATGVLDFVQPGSIVILHDGGGDRSETVAALPKIIRTLRRRGYRFVTLNEMFRLAPLPPCIPGAPVIFGRDGFTAATSSRIYKAWAALLCHGTNLGPATSSQYRLPHSVVGQDFRTTAHRLTWNVRFHRLRDQIVWTWASHAFAERGIHPRYGRPITQAWFRRYLSDESPGPALGDVHQLKGISFQHFLYDWAVKWRSGEIVWKPHFRPPSARHHPARRSKVR